MPSEIFHKGLRPRTSAKYQMGLKLYNIISRPPKVFSQFLMKSLTMTFYNKPLILGILFLHSKPPLSMASSGGAWKVQAKVGLSWTPTHLAKFIRNQVQDKVRLLPSSAQAPAQLGLNWLYFQLIQPPTPTNPPGKVFSQLQLTI